MIESFNNFCAEIQVTSSNELIIVPYAISGNNSVTRPSGITDAREVDTSAQIHSIYIVLKNTTKIKGIDRYNPSNFAAFNLYIVDNRSPNNPIMLVYDGRVAPGSSFFIEKNITLEPHQKLVLSCPNDSYDYDMDSKSPKILNQDSSNYLHVSASVVSIPSE